MTWVDHVRRHALTRPHASALRFGATTTTWLELHRRVTALADTLVQAGIGAGDRTATLMTNRPEAIEVVLAANAVGAIAVPVNFRLAEPEAANLLRDSGARLLVVDPPLVESAARLAESLELTPLAVGLDPGTAGSHGTQRYEDWVADGSPEFQPRPTNERDVALIMYTSGTTGQPKGAMLTHLNLMMQAIAMIRTHRMVHADDVYFVNVPLFHVAGIGTMPAPLLNGTPIVIMPTGAFSAEATLDAIESEAVTTMFMVPTQWQALCDHPDATRRTASLRTISWGGAPATEQLLRRMLDVFGHAEVVSVFGQTETSPPVASLPGGQAALAKLGSVGRAVPTVAYRIVDDTMRDVSPGEVGEIVYAGPMITSGYWRSPEATASAPAERTSSARRSKARLPGTRGSPISRSSAARTSDGVRRRSPSSFPATRKAPRDSRNSSVGRPTH